MPCHARHRRWAHSILLLLLLLFVVWLLGVVPVRKLQQLLVHVCYPAGLGREEWNVPRKKKLGIWRDGEGGVCMQMSTCHCAIVMDCPRLSVRSDLCPVPLTVAWHGGRQGCDYALRLACAGDDRPREVHQVRHIWTMSLSESSPLQPSSSTSKPDFPGAIQGICKDDRRVRSILLGPRAGSFQAHS